MNTTRRSFLKSGLLVAAASGARADGPAVSSAPRAGRRVLGRTGAEVSLLGLGLGSAFTGSHGQEPEAATALLEAALARGVNYFDTAISYANSQELMGPTVERHRAQIFLVTKTEQRSYDGFMRDFEASLKKLRTDRVDLMHVHNLNPKNDTDLAAIEKGAVKAQIKLRDQKAVRFIGITGHSGAQILMDAIRRWDPDCVMTTFPCNRPDNGKYEDELLPLARERKMGVIAMKTVRHAKNTDLKGTELIRYALSLEGVCVANVGLDSRAHLDENVAMAAAFKPLDAKTRTAMTLHAQRSLAGLTAPWDVPGYRDGGLPRPA